jgi:amidase
MQRLTRSLNNVFRNYGHLDGLSSKPPLSIRLGEQFIVETAPVCESFEKFTPEGIMSGNVSTGPVEVKDIRKGEVIACHIHSIEPVGHTIVGTAGVLAEEFEREDCFLVRLENGLAHFPGGIDVLLRPMIGCFGVVPENPPVPEPWMHGGNLDVTEVKPGSAIYLRAQRDGAWIAIGDAHAIQGEGEINGAALEIGADVVLSVERSRFSSITWPLIETGDEFIVVGIDRDWTKAVKKGIKEMSNLLSETNHISFAEAYMVVSHTADVRNGAVYMMMDEEDTTPVTVTVCLEKELFELD